MRTRWIIGAVVAAGLCVAVYARSQDSKPTLSNNVGGGIPASHLAAPIESSAGYKKSLHREPKAESESVNPDSLADLCKSMDEIQLQKTKLEEQEKQTLARMEKALQKQQKALDAYRAKLSGYRGGSASRLAPPPAPPTPYYGSTYIPQMRE